MMMRYVKFIVLCVVSVGGRFFMNNVIGSRISLLSVSCYVVMVSGVLIWF